MTVPKMGGKMMAYQQSTHCQIPEAIRPRHAEMVMVEMDELVGVSDEIEKFALLRLGSLIDDRPEPTSPENFPELPYMAPLFSDYRARCRMVRDTLRRLRNLLEKVEV